MISEDQLAYFTLGFATTLVSYLTGTVISLLKKVVD